MNSLFLEGLFLQASLIFALGAQNFFVLESGLKRQHPFVVSFTCFICDFTLIMIGVAGMATLLTQYHQIKIIFGVLGIFFMVLYGWSKIRHNLSASKDFLADSSKSTIKKSILLSMTFSILNPHAYLDAIVLIGGFSSKYALLHERIMIGLGASCFSLIWFLILSFSSSFMKPFLMSPKRMRFVTSISGICLIFLAGKLSTDVYAWLVEMANDPHCSFFGLCSPHTIHAGMQTFTNVQ
jgi:L-lysine exporter family protein LysE/ArgO